MHRDLRRQIFGVKYQSPSSDIIFGGLIAEGDPYAGWPYDI